MNSSIHKWIPLGIIATAFLLFAALFQWGIFPFQRLIVEKANTIEANHALQESKENRVKELPQLREQYDLILQDEGKFDTLVSHDQVVPFIESIELLAHGNDVEISITNQDQALKNKVTAPKNADKLSDESSSNTEKKKDESILKNLPFDQYMSLRLDVRGEYAKVAQFLHQLESLSYSIDVVSLDIRQWEPSDSGVSRGSAFVTNNPIFSDGTASVSEQPVAKKLVQAFFSIVVYTKD